MRQLGYEEMRDITDLIAAGNRLNVAITVVGVHPEEFAQALHEYPDWGDCLVNAEEVAQIWLVSALPPTSLWRRRA